ncbi:hypothetical protein WAX74_03425 [Psychrobacillus sp. FJAT-51614]|uniref:Uncharacterized protein n=1 Tax=Psychrobacillus mangrovi TaxID=3117745 RepID=A0ABU8F122_9BACI
MKKSILIIIIFAVSIMAYSNSEIIVTAVDSIDGYRTITVPPPL